MGTRDYWAVELHVPDGVNSVSTAPAVSLANSTSASAGEQVGGNASGGDHSSGEVSMEDTGGYSENSTAASTIPGTDWRTRKASLQVQVAGFGISNAFTGQRLTAVEQSATGHEQVSLSVLGLMCGALLLRECADLRT